MPQGGSPAGRAGRRDPGGRVFTLASMASHLVHETQSPRSDASSSANETTVSEVFLRTVDGQHHLAALATFSADVREDRAVEGRLVLASPVTAMTPLSNAAEVRRHVALVQRGEGDFVTKARNAMQAGALAVVVGNTAERVLKMKGPGRLAIPVLGVSRDTYEALRESLRENPFRRVTALRLSGPAAEAAMPAAEPTSPEAALVKAAKEDKPLLVAELLQGLEATPEAKSAANSALRMAAAGGHEECAVQLIAAGANVGWANKDGATPLLEAAAGGHVPVMELLLEHAAPVDAAAADGATPLLRAARRGHAAAVALLLEHGADPAQAPTLLEAAGRGRAACVELLARSAPQLVEKVDDRGRSPLLRAAGEGHTATVEALVRAGARVEQCDRLGRSPLSAAVAERHADTARALLRLFAQQLSRYVAHHRADLLIEGKTGVLLTAVHARDEELIAALCEPCRDMLEERVALVMPTPRDDRGRTPLILAMPWAERELVRRVARYQQGWDTRAWSDVPVARRDELAAQRQDLWLADKRGMTALMHACRESNLGGALEVLAAIPRGSTPPGINAREAGMGRTALHFAADSPSDAHEVVQALLTYGAAVNLADANGWSPLHYAVRRGHVSTIDLLLRFSANVNAQTRRGSTALHVAAQLGRIRVVRTLLAADARVDLEDSAKCSPLVYALAYRPPAGTRRDGDGGAAVTDSEDRSDRDLSAYTRQVGSPLERQAAKRLWRQFEQLPASARHVQVDIIDKCLLQGLSLPRSLQTHPHLLRLLLDYAYQERREHVLEIVMDPSATATDVFADRLLQEAVHRRWLASVWMRTVLRFAAWLVLLAVLSFSAFMQSGRGGFTSHHFHDVLVGELAAPFEAAVTSADSLWDFLEDELVPALNGFSGDAYYDADGALAALDGVSSVASHSHMLGAARVRQLRTAPADCVTPPEFDGAPSAAVCFDPFSPASAVEHETFGQGWAWQAADVPPVYGMLRSYPGSGFSAVLPGGGNQTTALRRLAELRADSWIDLGTRAVVVELAVVNWNEHLLATVALVTEMPVTGGVAASSEVRLVHALPAHTVLDRLAIFVDAVLAVLLLGYFARELYNMLRPWAPEYERFAPQMGAVFPVLFDTCLDVRINPYFVRASNYFDMLLLLLLLAVGALRASAAGAAADVDWELLGVSPDAFPADVFVVGDALRWTLYLLGLAICVAWLKLFEFMFLTSGLSTSLVVVGRMIKKVVSFLAVSVVFLVAFSMVDYVSFSSVGKHSTETFFLAFMTQLRANTLGNGWLDDAASPDLLISSAFYALYLFAALIVLMSLLLTGLTDAFRVLSGDNGALWCQVQFRAIVNEEALGPLVRPRLAQGLRPTYRTDVAADAGLSVREVNGMARSSAAAAGGKPNTIFVAPSPSPGGSARRPLPGSGSGKRLKRGSSGDSTVSPQRSFREVSEAEMAMETKVGY